MLNEISNINDLNDLEQLANKLVDIRILLNTEGAAKNNGLIMLKNYWYSHIIARKKELETKQKHEKINLKNLLKKTHLKRKNLWNIYKKYPYLNRNLGNVPHVFIKDVENKKQCVEQIYELFGKYSLVLNYDMLHLNDPNYVEVTCLKDQLAEELSMLIQKKVKISFAGNGFFGNGYKIKVYDEEKKYEFFYKVFYPHDKRTRHGADVEIMYAYFANHNGRKKQFAKFYMGRMASPIEKDAFILTEFVKRQDDYKINPTIFLDYIVSLDKRVDNTINGRTVDFGDIKEYAPELRDKALRKLVRIILMRICNRINEDIVEFNWTMNEANCKSLKNYYNKIDKKLYKRAVNVIKKYITTLPADFIKDLRNIKKWGKKHTIHKKKFLQQSDIITSDLKELKKNIKYLNLLVLSSLDGSDLSFGYVMLDLFKNRQAVYILDKDNNITRMRIEKKVDNKFQTLLELRSPEYINSYNNDKFIELLCS